MATPVGKFFTALQEKHLSANAHGTEDLIIELKYCKWAVHKKKLEDASGFFKGALKPGRWEEAIEGRMRLPDADPIMFARVVQFVYLGQYQYESRLGTGWSDYITRVTENSDLRYLVTGENGYPTHLLEASDKKSNQQKFNKSDIPEEGQLNEADTPDYIRKGPWVYKRLQDEDSIAMTPQERDLRADMAKTRAQIDMEMFILADQYIMPSLKEYALAKLQYSINFSPRVYAKPEYISLLNFINDSFEKLVRMDDDFSALLAQFIAKHYRSIRLGEHADSSNILRCLPDSSRFTLLVMDRLAWVDDWELKRVRDKLQSQYDEACEED